MKFLVDNQLPLFATLPLYPLSDKVQFPVVNQLLQNALNQAVDGLVRHLGASHVYLFGSCAKENTSSPNDIDLLVVVPDGIGSKLENARKAYRATRSLPFSKDIIVEHESVFRKRARWTSSIEREVLETGKLIYGRT